jgi:hypothetical protein
VVGLFGTSLLWLFGVCQCILAGIVASLILLLHLGDEFLDPLDLGLLVSPGRHVIE